MSHHYQRCEAVCYGSGQKQQGGGYEADRRCKARATHYFDGHHLCFTHHVVAATRNREQHYFYERA